MNELKAVFWLTWPFVMNDFNVTWIHFYDAVYQFPHIVHIYQARPNVAVASRYKLPVWRKFPATFFLMSQMQNSAHVDNLRVWKTLHGAKLRSLCVYLPTMGPCLMPYWESKLPSSSSLFSLRDICRQTDSDMRHPALHPALQQGNKQATFQSQTLSVNV